MPTVLPPDLRPMLESGLADLGLAPAHAPRLLDYLALLVHWNAAFNLTAIRDPREMVTKHLLDSLAMHRHVDALVATGDALADLGTGAGLPGIPLAIVKPGLRVTLVESAGKKARFMRQAIRELGLADVRVAESRIESLDEPGAYAAITARALATIPLILELGRHLLAADGVLLAMKGVHPIDELVALPAGWVLKSSEPLRVPGLQAERHLVTVGRG